MLKVQLFSSIDHPPPCTTQCSRSSPIGSQQVALRRPNARAAADDQNVFLAGFFTLAWLAVVICPVLGATALHRLQIKTIRRAQRLSRCLRDGLRETTRLVYSGELAEEGI